jgi:hypothetical protein
MIPSVAEIQEALNQGRITERQAEERFFLISLVERDFHASRSIPTRAATRLTLKDRYATLTPAEDALIA